MMVLNRSISTISSCSIYTHWLYNDHNRSPQNDEPYHLIYTNGFDLEHFG